MRASFHVSSKTHQADGRNNGDRLRLLQPLLKGPSGKLFCANNGNKFYVFRANGTKSSEFGWVDGINSLSGNHANVAALLQVNWSLPVFSIKLVD